MLVISAGAGQLLVSATPAAAGSCSSQGGQNVTDPNTGWHWSTKWWCGNRGGASLYRDASYDTRTAIMDTTWSWFVCYRRGVTHAGGNNVWYYTVGDRAVAGQEGRRQWGYMPAVDVWTSTDPWPGMPACPGTTPPPPPPPAPNCIHPTFSVYPGSASSNLRYGEVRFRIDACSNVAPADWGTSVTSMSTTGPGATLGFGFTSATISTTGSGYGYADYEAVINFEVCPFRVPICTPGESPFKARYHGYVDIEAGTNAPHVFFSSGEAPFTYDLFLTP